MEKITLAHIISPKNFNDPKNGNSILQPIAFESLRVAKQNASGLEVQLFSTQYAEDRDYVPDFFTKTEDLSRSIRDIKRFWPDKKLPLMADILQKLYENSDAEYVIYTNSNISVQPDFYQTVAGIISQGYDGFAINKRMIADKYSDPSQLPQMYLEKGEWHAGFDCFVFRREALPNYYLGTTCLGVPYFDWLLLLNIWRHARKFHLYKELTATFQIGSDAKKLWKQPWALPYQNHNLRHLKKFLRGLSKEQKKRSLLIADWEPLFADTYLNKLAGRVGIFLRSFST